MTNQMSLRVADLPQNAPTAFELRPDSKTLDTLKSELGLLGLRKLSFVGNLQAHSKRDWQLTGKLGATVIQPCVVTLEPVTTRIETQVKRLFLADWAEPNEPEFEVTDDDETEALKPEIDLGLVMVESLALALPPYPRKEGAHLEQVNYTEPGKQALTDEDVKPFAELASLRDQLKKDE